MKPVDERDNFEFDGAVLVARSRAGTTENVRLADGALVEVYYYKSGRIGCQGIKHINDSLTMRGEQPYQIIGTAVPFIGKR